MKIDISQFEPPGQSITAAWFRLAKSLPSDVCVALYNTQWRALKVYQMGVGDSSPIVNEKDFEEVCHEEFVHGQFEDAAGCRPGSQAGAWSILPLPCTSSNVLERVFFFGGTENGGRRKWICRWIDDAVPELFGNYDCLLGASR